MEYKYQRFHPCTQAKISAPAQREYPQASALPNPKNFLWYMDVFRIRQKDGDGK
jgi:hypothetical protein